MTMTSSSIAIQRELDRFGGKVIATGDEAILWQIGTGDGRLVIETTGDPVWENESGFGTLACEVAAQHSHGEHYRSPAWRKLVGDGRLGWDGVWPVIDADGNLTGLVVSDDDAYFNVDDEAMIAEDDLDCRWEEVDGHAVPVTAAIEAAVSDETIRGHGGIDEFAGLEHSAMNEACVAYRLAAANAIEDDARCGRLAVIAPRGQRIVASGWSGSHWMHSAGALGTMQRLTEDEQAALAAAHDAGLAAARAVIERADAEMEEAEGE